MEANILPLVKTLLSFAPCLKKRLRVKEWVKSEARIVKSCYDIALGDFLTASCAV